MFCSNCGKQLEDGVRFCKYCGVPTSHPETATPELEGEPSIKREEEHHAVQEKPVTAAESPKLRTRKGIILPVVLIVVVVIGAGVYLAQSMSGHGNDSADAGKSESVETTENATVDNFYASPELPDALVIDKYDNGNYSRYFVEGQTLVKITDDCWDVQLAKDGTLAMRIDNGGVLIYRDGEQIGEIPKPVKYFYLCGSGEKIVYGTTEQNSYLWDISTGESNLVSNDYSSCGISYDGSMLDMREHYSRNGRAFYWMPFSYIRDMSPDGKYVYYGKSYRNTSSDGTEQNNSVFGIMINGDEHELFSYSDPDDSFYPDLIACSQDYREVLFRVNDDIYYFSVENAANAGFHAQHIGNINGGMLLSVNQAVTSNNIFKSDDAISSWCNDWYDYPSYQGYQYRTQKSIRNGVFCLLKEQNGIKTASLVRLVNDQLVELIPNITGNICLSADETKLWCVADGRLTFCDLSAESPHAIYCDTAYVRALSEDGEVGVSGERIEEWEMTTVPIAVTPDGETACFISVDGSLWMCTSDMIHDPQLITDRAFWVQCSADNTFYLMKGDSYEYFQGRACDLYLVNTNGEMEYQYSNVMDVCMTKNDVYISVGGGDSAYPGATKCALYCISNGGYSLIYNDYNANELDLCWWGKNH